MKKVVFHEAVGLIANRDKRYHEHAYFFIREALDFSIKAMNKPSEGPGRHISGQELVEGIRQFALQEYGPMAKTVLACWGVHRCEDFGELVFNLVDAGVLGKTAQDRKEDFAGGYDFETAFRKPYRPRAVLPRTVAPEGVPGGAN
jgi:uncharacterized repeat protein (TIGR04138 family)